MITENRAARTQRGGTLSLDKSNGRLRILRLMLAVRETSAPYNQFSLPLAERQNITLCTYFPCEVTPPKTITLFEGDGTVAGFFRAFHAAVSGREYDVIHVHSPHLGLFYLIASLFNRQATAPAVITVHDSYQNYKLRNRLLFVPVFAGFQKVICCGRASYDSFPAFYRWLAGDRLTAVRNGLDLGRVDGIATDSRRARRTADFTVMAVSRLVAIKNPAAVVTAFQLSADPGSRLLYAGDGPLRHSLVAMSRAAGLSDQIEFSGIIPRERVFEHLLGADLFVSTSRGEGLPIAVLEAMACGCPVLLSDIPPHREIAAGVDFVPLVQPDDGTGFAREIERFRKMPAAARRTIGQQCRALVEERFSMTAMHAGYAAIYAQMAARSHPARPE